MTASAPAASKPAPAKPAATQAPQAPQAPPAKPAPPMTENEPEFYDEPEPEDEPIREVVDIAGLVMEKTIHSDGECETRVLRQPLISDEEIKQTRAAQKQEGF
jgi:hypothetical protein